jgi:hypothetical protein
VGSATGGFSAMFIPGRFPVVRCFPRRRLLNMPDARQRVCPMPPARQFAPPTPPSGDVQRSGPARRTDLLCQKMDNSIKPGQ